MGAEIATLYLLDVLTRQRPRSTLVPNPTLFRSTALGVRHTRHTLRDTATTYIGGLSHPYPLTTYCPWEAPHSPHAAGCCEYLSRGSFTSLPPLHSLPLGSYTLRTCCGMLRIIEPGVVHIDRKSTRLNSIHVKRSRMLSSAC